MATKNFKLGDTLDFMGRIIYEYVEDRYSQELFFRGGLFDPVTGDYTADKTVTIPLNRSGSGYNVEMGASGDYQYVELRVKALDGFKLTYFEVGSYGGTSYTLTDELLTYRLNANEINQDYFGIREYLISADIEETTPITKAFAVGNIYNSNGISYEGNIQYTALVELSNATETINIDLVLGVITDIDITGYDTITLKAVANDGYKLSSFENIAFPENAYTLTDANIEYTLSSEEMGGNDLDWFKYVIIAVEEDSIEPTITNNYELSKSEYAQFQDEIIRIRAVENADNKTVFVTDYLTSVRVYPFDVTADNILEKQAIKIRNYTLNTNGDFLKYDYIDLDFGSIVIPLERNDFTAIHNVSCELILPFKQGSIPIDNYYIGKTIDIKGRLNIISGDMTITVYNNGTAFNITSFNIGSDIPIYNSNRIIGDEVMFNHALNDVLKAYVLVQLPIYNVIPKVNIKGNLLNENGYIQVEEANFSTDATSEEKDMILTALRSGVIIND